jgi:lipoprotein NlpD
VRAGDTLFAIGRRYGLDWRDIARWNGLDPTEVIRPGDRLRLGPRGGGSSGAAVAEAAPARASPDDPAYRPPTWQWPVAAGRVVGPVRQPSGGIGLRIDGALNAPVLAAADGTVAYTGTGLLGYGQLVIVNHVRGWLTAYGHNAAVNVKEGESVRAGQPIAAMGTGPDGQPMLYFEIRLDGVALDPLTQLPKR